MKGKSENTVPDRKEQIFQATLDLVKERGMAGITMDLIAKKSKLAIGTLYLYFPTKEQLLISLYLECKQRTSVAINLEIDDKLPIKNRLKLMFVRYFQSKMDCYEEHHFMDQFYASHLMTEEIKLASFKPYQPLINDLILAQQEELIKKAPIEMVISILFGIVKEFTNLQKAKGRDMDSQELEFAWQMTWDAIKL